MDLTFKNQKLQKNLTTESSMVCTHGPKRAALLKQRLTELEAAQTLAIMRHIPRARCHELKGNLKGQLSVDLDHPYRLLFMPDHDPQPKAPAGGLDWTAVTRIKIIEIADTHE